MTMTKETLLGLLGEFITLPLSCQISTDFMIKHHLAWKMSPNLLTLFKKGLD